MARLTAIPGVGSAVRAGTALALYGALDGQPNVGRVELPGPGRLAKGPA
jgi:hypothetical protein